VNQTTGGGAALVGVGPRRADHRRAARRAPRRPQRQRPRRAARPRVHRGGAVRHRRVRPPRGRVRGRRPRCRRRRCSCRASAWSSRSAWPRSSASSRARSTARRSATPRVTVARATFVGRRVHRAVLRVSSWAMVVTVGAADIQKQTAENGPGRRVRGPGRALGRRRRDARQRAVPHQRVRRHPELPQRRGPLPLRARPGAGAPRRTEPGQHAVGRPDRGIAGAERACASWSWPCSRVGGRPGAADVHLAVRHGRRSA
jgi:hypothetical protein